MNKTVLMTIMKQSRLRKNILTHIFKANKGYYNAEKNLRVCQVRKAKKEYFDNLDHIKITGNKTLLKFITPFVQIKN